MQTSHMSSSGVQIIVANSNKQQMTWLETLLPALLLQSFSIHRLCKRHSTSRLVWLGDWRVNPLWSQHNVALDLAVNK